MIETKKEAVDTIYKNGELVGIIKRDDKVKKHLTYVVKDANADDIVGFINSNSSKE